MDIHTRLYTLQMYSQTLELVFNFLFGISGHKELNTTLYSQICQFSLLKFWVFSLV